MIFLFLLLTQPTHKQIVSIENLYLTKNPNGHVDESGLYINTTDALLHFDFDLNLVFTIKGSENGIKEIRSFHVEDDFIWIVDDPSYSSFFYDKKGNFLFHDPEVFSNNIQKLSDGTYIITPGFAWNASPKQSPFLRQSNFVDSPFPKLLKTMKLEITSKGIDSYKEIQTFYKAPKSLSEVNFSFKKLWAFKKANTFTIVNQIDNVKSVYSPVHLNQERQIPPIQPYKARTVPLGLPNFQEFEKPFKPKDFYEDSRDYVKDAICFLYSFSTIEKITTTNYGYLIGYTVPTVPCERGFLKVHKMNRDFRPQSSVIDLDRHGIFLGINAEKLFILVPNLEVKDVLIVGAAPEIWVFDLDS